MEGPDAEFGAVRTVFSSAEDVAGVWAKDSQPEGRTPNRRVRFSAGIIRSYGFPMAMLFRAPGGERFALIEDLHPSQTTAAQISLSRAAAVREGATLIELEGVGGFEGMYTKVTKRHLSDLRERLETEIAARLADVERYEPVSWAQSQRLGIIAKKIGMHQALARAFGLDWPPQASQEAFEARARASAAGASRKTEVHYSELSAERDKYRATVEKERREVIDPAREVELWLRGERMSLQHQPAEQFQQRVRFRIVGRKAETNDRRSLPFSEFSKMFRAAVAVAAGQQDGNRIFQVGRQTYRVDGGGDLHTTYGGREVIYFDDLMACVEAKAPRLFAQAQRMLDPAPERALAP